MGQKGWHRLGLGAIKSLSGVICNHLEDIRIFLVNSNLDHVIYFPPYYYHLSYYLTQYAHHF